MRLEIAALIPRPTPRFPMRLIATKLPDAFWTPSRALFRAENDLHDVKPTFHVSRRKTFVAANESTTATLPIPCGQVLLRCSTLGIARAVSQHQLAPIRGNRQPDERSSRSFIPRAENDRALHAPRGSLFHVADSSPKHASGSTLRPELIWSRVTMPRTGPC
jgi:hypothetical protein